MVRIKIRQLATHILGCWSRGSKEQWRHRRSPSTWRHRIRAIQLLRSLATVSQSAQRHHL